MRNIAFLIAMAWFFFPGLQERCEALSIDLNEFYAEGNVSVSADGNSATITEDPDYGSAYLSNDPYFFDPGVFIPLDSRSLTFDFIFNEPFGNVDEFYVKLFDWNTNTILSDYNGNLLEFSLTESGTGTVNWDLANASFLGDTVAMQFELNFDPDNDPNPPSSDLSQNSSLTISNVQINPVPEPGTLSAMIVGLLCICFLMGRKIARKT